ncbi:hypothetical protein ACPCSP_33530 [Streptomyces cinereoruber]|uniref:hypothetical protein n=1 Tax=Streptomyces cinereoruber TaxID=67260 RepID=UPI003C2EAEF5
MPDLGGEAEPVADPGAVEFGGRREDLADLVVADTSLRPEQAAARLLVRRADFDWMVKLKWIRATEWAEVQCGTSRAGVVEVPLYCTADVDALPGTHPEVGWEELRRVEKGWRSPLAALHPKTEAKVAPAPA